MKVLVIGSGGREHALAWKIAQSDRVNEVLVAPGNAGTAQEPGLRNCAVDAEDIDALLELARAESVALTVVGPEAPLVAGIVDRFQAAGLACFGPGAAAAQLEGSKQFAKDFMARYQIPTARYGVFTDVDEAKAFIRTMGAPIVVKADGLAAGKGVIVAKTVSEATAAAEDMLAGNRFGDAGSRIVVEQFLAGEEASFIVIADGQNILPLASSQDHKARDNGDQGPNTGGMGAYSPAPIVDDAMTRHVMDTIIRPTIRGMAAEGHPFVGFLYAGLMIDAQGKPHVLEYNVRFGDPETQPVMMRLKSDLVDHLQAALDGSLDQQQTRWDDRPCLGVVLAASGYPDAYPKGGEIRHIPEAQEDRKVFHAGTAMQGGKLVSSGGRVLCACALADDVAEAQRKAYALADAVDWDDKYYRTDIGYRAIT